MTATLKGDVTDQAQKYWAPLFTKELRESLLLGGLVNKDYEGSITKGGDTVYVSQVNAPTGELLTVGTDGDVFNSSKVSMSRVAISANKRAVASFKVADEAELQSQLGDQKSAMREALRFAMEEQINNYLYSLVAPSTSAPDHEIASVTDFNAAQLSACRVLAGEAKWSRNSPWYGLLSPAYYGDACDDATLASADFNGGDTPVVAGQMAKARFGFNLLEDNSRTGDYGLLFHPDFMHMVMQTQVQVKISDLHPLGQFGYLISTDVIFGAGLGISGAVKHIRVR
jgi:hypothetical protein